MKTYKEPNAPLLALGVFLATFLMTIIFYLIMTPPAEAATGRLSDEYVEGRSRFCVYDMGNGRSHVLVVDAHDRCPRSYRD
jgi:hypothetical protein